MVSCQVIINRIDEAKINIAEKKNKLLDQLSSYVTDLENIEYQMQELRKPFISEDDPQVRFTVRDTYKEYQIPQRVSMNQNIYEAN